MYCESEEKREMRVWMGGTIRVRECVGDAGTSGDRASRHPAVFREDRKTGALEGDCGCDCGVPREP